MNLTFYLQFEVKLKSRDEMKESESHNEYFDKTRERESSYACGQVVLTQLVPSLQLYTEETTSTITLVLCRQKLILAVQEFSPDDV